MGCLAFIFLYIFDLNKVYHLHNGINICFALGIVLLAISTMGLLFAAPESFPVYFPLRMIFGLLSALSFFLILHALFFALPFKKTYIETNNKNMVIDKGMYALCRHPGVLWFFLFYIFLWLASGKMTVLWAGLVWTLMDIIHVYVQDRWLFPITLDGYDLYRERVPFLIPTFDSIKQFVITRK